MSNVINNLTDELSPILHDPCGEAAVRQNWQQVGNNFKKLNEAPNLVNEFGQLVKEEAFFERIYIGDTVNYTEISPLSQYIVNGFPAPRIWYSITAVGVGSITVTIDTVADTDIVSVSDSVTVTVPSGHWPGAAVGNKGVAMYSVLLGDWIATCIECTTEDAGGSTATATASVDSSGAGPTYAITAFIYSTGSSGSVTTVTNPRNHQWMVGDNLFVLKNGATGNWEVVDVTLHSRELQISNDFSSPNFRYQHGSFAIEQPDATVDNTNWDSEASCP